MWHDMDFVAAAGSVTGHRSSYNTELCSGAFVHCSLSPALQRRLWLGLGRWCWVAVERAR
jgi:hypothetical protein